MGNAGTKLTDTGIRSKHIEGILHNFLNILFTHAMKNHTGSTIQHHVYNGFRFFLCFMFPAFHEVNLFNTFSIVCCISLVICYYRVTKMF